MFRNVLVPVDGSAVVEHSLPWALAAAEPAGTLHLVNAHVPPAPLLVEGAVIADPSIDQVMREQEADYLSKLVERLHAAAAAALSIVSCNIDTEDAPADALAQAIRDTAVNLVVMGTHARGPFARFWLGSVSDDLLRRSPVPVLLLRGSADDPPADLSKRPELDRLILPLDGSELAERIIDPAVKLAAVFGAELVLVLVLDSLSDPDAVARIQPPEVPDSLNPLTPTQRAEMYLDRVARSIAERNGTVRTQLIREGSPAEVVLKLADGDPRTGVALATHGRAGLSRLVAGSVADAIIRGAAGPVLAFHPPA
jgi:nucleotide-binding universal stress UspA family protein